MKYESLIKPPASKVLKSGRVILSPNEEVGEHKTEKKEEVIIVLKGKATIIEEGKESFLNEKEIHYIKEDVLHNIRNDTEEELEYIYIVSLFEK